MAKYRIKAPDGRVYEMDAPDSADETAVLALAQKTLGGGAVSERRAYGPHGEEAGLTGLHDNRAHQYAPVLGRFLQPAPIGDQGGLNLYPHDGTIATTRVGWDGTIITERSDEYYALSPMERGANDVHENVHVEQLKPYSGRGILGAIESRIDYALNPPGFEIPAHQAQVKFLESYRTTTDIDDRIRYNAIMRVKNNLGVYEKRNR